MPPCSITAGCSSIDGHLGPCHVPISVALPGGWRQVRVEIRAVALGAVFELAPGEQIITARSDPRQGGDIFVWVECELPRELPLG